VHERIVAIILANTATDGGFFVFPDVTVRLEGEFRLRFSLFEMLKSVRFHKVQGNLQQVDW